MAGFGGCCLSGQFLNANFSAYADIELPLRCQPLRGAKRSLDAFRKQRLSNYPQHQERVLSLTIQSPKVVCAMDPLSSQVLD